MKNQQWSDLIKSFSAWASGAVSLATAIISFVLIVQGNYHLGITVLGILLFLVILLLLIYWSFAKTPPLIEGGKGVYSYEKYRPLTFSGIVLLLFIACSIFLFKETRLFMKNAFISAKLQKLPSDKASITIEQVLFSNSQNSTRIEATITNSMEVDFIVTGLTLIAEKLPTRSCSGSGTTKFTFKVGSVSILNKINNNLNLSWEFQNIDDPNYSYQATGAFYTNCTNIRVEIDMPISLTVPSKNVANIQVEFPNDLTIEKNNVNLLFSDSDLFTLSINTNSNKLVHPFYKGVTEKGIETAARFVVADNCEDIFENPKILGKYIPQKSNIGGLDETYLDIQPYGSDELEKKYSVKTFFKDGKVITAIYTSKYNLAKFKNELTNQSQFGYKLTDTYQGIYFITSVGWQNKIVTIYEQNDCGRFSDIFNITDDRLLWLDDYGNIVSEYERIDIP